MSQSTTEVLQDLIISIDPERMSGTPVFAGTRVPVHYLFEHLIDSAGVDDFIEGFPGAGRERVNELLKRIGALVEAGEIQV